MPLNHGIDPRGGGGVSRLLAEGDVIEKGGVM